MKGLPLRVSTVGSGPRRVLWIGGIHGDEPEGAVATAALPAALAPHLGEVTVTILEDANPDGRQAGTRGNANGVDINRNFPSRTFDATKPEYGGSPLSQPEARAVAELVEQVDPDLLVVMHSWRGREFINYDGPARELADRFSRRSGLVVEPSDAINPTPGSLGSWAGIDRGIPLLTVEILRGTPGEATWTRIRDAAIDVIRRG